jgi:hypothetical protein
MGYYQEEIMVQCIISFKMPEGYNDESISKLLPHGIKDWDDLELDDETNTVSCKYTYRTNAKMYHQKGDWYTEDAHFIEEFSEYKMDLPPDLIISEEHDIIDFMG